MDELISRKAVLELPRSITRNMKGKVVEESIDVEKIKAMPPVQPEIIRCKDCKHWNLQVGNVKGDGLGSCDFHNVNLVTGEGFCYWADRRGEADE